MRSRIILQFFTLGFLALSFGALVFSFHAIEIHHGVINLIWPYFKIILLSSLLALILAAVVALPILSSKKGVSNRAKYALAGMSGLPTILVALASVWMLRAVRVELDARWMLVLMTILLVPRALQLLELSIPRKLNRYREALLALGGTSQQFAWVWLWRGRTKQWLRRFLKLSIIGVAEASALWVFVVFSMSADLNLFIVFLNEQFIQTAPAILMICVVLHFFYSALEER